MAIELQCGKPSSLTQLQVHYGSWYANNYTRWCYSVYRPTYNIDMQVMYLYIDRSAHLPPNDPSSAKSPRRFGQVHTIQTTAQSRAMLFLSIADPTIKNRKGPYLMTLK